MTDGLDGVRDHYRATGLTERLKTAPAVFGPEDQRLTPEQLAILDQFHTRGLAATAELAQLAGIAADMSVLDVGWAGALSGCNLWLPGYWRRPQRAFRGCRALSVRAHGTERAGVVPDRQRAGASI
jgi:hypothetical protein